MTIFKHESHKPLSQSIWIPAASTGMKQLPQSKVKYNSLSKAFLQVSLGKHHQHKSKCLKALSRLTMCLGWSLVLCMLACLGLIIYTQMTKQNVKSGGADQCSIDEDNRFDCWPEKNGANEPACLSRGCCWKASTLPNTAPYCFFPSGYNGYNATQVTVTSSGIDATLVRSTSTFFSPDIKTLKLRIDFQNEYRLRVKFYDPNNARFEVPLDVPTGSTSVQNPLYNVTVQKQPFNLVIRRVSTGAIIFDTTDTAPLIFSDQYLQIATKLSSRFLYGLGEHRSSFLQDVNTWKRLVFWNRDDVPKVDNNGYGTHPFFLNLEPSNKASSSFDAHGVFLLNSNAGEVALQPYGPSQNGAVTYRMLGGVLDFFIILGPKPLSIVSQFSEIVGKTYLPPFWSLGFHICKYGITNSTVLRDIINRNRNSHMPYDIQWTDIDYMDGRKDWTYDKNNFADLPAIVQDLHNNQQRYILMADPAISSEQPPGTYPPFDDGKQLDVFVKNASGDILVGSVWPGKTAFPDFFHPNALQYWYKQANDFHAVLQFDGLWIDMNEPSSFVDGSVTGCTPSSLDHPPFVPATIDGGNLIAKTICPSAKQYLSTHYNLHNMYGWSQANITRGALTKIFPNRRSPIISRSSYAGSAKYTGHWLGDNNSDFDDLYYSIPGVLNFNLFGITFIGADICGFRGTTTPELCTRWMQLGAFYTFMRNHADFSSPAQDPGSFDDPFRSYMREALQLRYRLLAVLYTGLYRAHVDGLPVIRPLFYLYPGTESIDKEFMWGDSLLIVPVLDNNVRIVNAFIPNDSWYDFYTGSAITVRGEYLTLNAPLDKINLLVRGGSVLSLLPPTERTDVSRQQKFQLLIACSDDKTASGELFWDDGESADSITASKYSHISFFLYPNNTLTNKIDQNGYNPSSGVKADNFVVYGVQQSPSNVFIDDKQVPFSYKSDTKVLSVGNQDVDLLQPFTLYWK